MGLVCTGCTAPLPPRDHAGVSICRHCGRVHEAGAGDQAEPVASASPALVITAVAMLLAVGALVAAFSLVQTSTESPVHTEQSSGPSLLKAFTPTPRYLWDDVGGLPARLDVGGVEMFIGRIRFAGEDMMAIRATRLADAKEAWTYSGLGTYSDGYRATRFAVVDGLVAVTDAHAKLHVLDGATGAELRSASLTDVAERLCVVDGAFRVEQVDKRTVQVDPQTAKVTESSARCPTTHRSEGKADVPGFKTVQRWPGATAVITAVKDPGTPTPRAFGLRDGVQAWATWIPSIDFATVRNDWGTVIADHEGDRLVAVYGEGTEIWHLTAIDTTNGARVWDVKLRPIFAVDSIDSIQIEGARVLVERTSSLDVFDLATGKQVGVVGVDTYDDQ